MNIHWTDEFNALRQAEQAFEAAPMDLAASDALEAAERAYYTALEAARTAFNALPEGVTKQRAEENAHDTDGARTDKLKFLQAALSTYQYLLDTEA